MQKQRGPTLSLRAKGPLAIFTRPELKTERVSYEVPTPSAVRGIFEAVCWKPAIQWHVERIYVFNEISFTAMKRNELNSKSIMPSKQMVDCGMREFTYRIKLCAEESGDIAVKNCTLFLQKHARGELEVVIPSEMKGNDLIAFSYQTEESFVHKRPAVVEYWRKINKRKSAI